MTDFQIELVMMFDEREDAERAVDDIEQEDDIDGVELTEYNSGRYGVNATVTEVPEANRHGDLLDYCRGRYGHVLSTADKCWAVMVRRDKSA